MAVLRGGRREARAQPQGRNRRARAKSSVPHSPPSRLTFMGRSCNRTRCEKKCGGAAAARNRDAITKFEACFWITAGKNSRSFWPQGLSLLGFGILLALNWPGQMSYDSVVQLADGRSGHYDSWHPPVMAWLLGLFDELSAGPGPVSGIHGFLAAGRLAFAAAPGAARLGRRDLLILIVRHAAASSLPGHDLEGRIVRQCGNRRVCGPGRGRREVGGRRARRVFLAGFVRAAAEPRGAGAAEWFFASPDRRRLPGLIAAKKQPVRAGWRYGAGLLIARS